jgi:hypothetical protein
MILRAGGPTAANHSRSFEKIETATTCPVTAMCSVRLTACNLDMHRIAYFHSMPVDNRGALSVKLAFQTRELRELCESQVRAERALGIVAAKRLRGLLADLDIAETLEEIPVEELREREVGGPADYEAPLVDGFVLRMRIRQQAGPTTGQIDRSSVRRLKILEIEKIEVSHG